jgi:hypothetical protein
MLALAAHWPAGTVIQRRLECFEARMLPGEPPA